MSYKYELHTHTGCVSQCGRVEPERIVDIYVEAGYSGIVVTDHYSPLTFRYPNRYLTPQKHIDFYLSGYRRMKRYAPEGFTVLLGIELRHYASANDYLIYGVEEEWLERQGNLMAVWEKEMSKMMHDQGYLVFQAHPFRPYLTRCNPDLLDGMEIYNGKCDKKTNEKALKWAQETGKLVCAGSDFHTEAHLARGGIITEKPIKNNADLLEVLRSQNFKTIETY